MNWRDEWRDRGEIHTFHSIPVLIPNPSSPYTNHLGILLHCNKYYFTSPHSEFSRRNTISLQTQTKLTIYDRLSRLLWLFTESLHSILFTSIIVREWKKKNLKATFSFEKITVSGSLSRLSTVICTFLYLCVPYYY